MPASIDPSSSHHKPHAKTQDEREGKRTTQRSPHSNTQDTVSCGSKAHHPREPCTGSSLCSTAMGHEMQPPVHLNNMQKSTQKLAPTNGWKPMLIQMERASLIMSIRILHFMICHSKKHHMPCTSKPSQKQRGGTDYSTIAYPLYVSSHQPVLVDGAV